MLKKILRFLSYILVAAVACVVTLVLTASPDTNTGHGLNKYELKLQQLKELILERHIDDVDETAMDLAAADGAAEGMIYAAGDRWSYYIPASQLQAHNEQMANAYVGIGVTIVQMDDGYLEITKVDKGSPALEAGLQAGDILTAVEGADIAELGLDESKNRIRGEEGTQVEITFRRGEESITQKVYRRTIKTVVAEGQMLDGNVGLVTIVNFDERCYQETVAAIEQMLNAGAEALIFDVRYNPGGYKSELVKLLDYLLPEGPLFRSVDYTGAENVDSSDADCLEIPMAVLVNVDSYSAAEFFAAALSEYEAAIVVGEQTTGKGYFQNTFSLVDGSAVSLSVGKYCTPNGISLEGVGITPDVEVEVDDETYSAIYAGTVTAEEDPQIQAALKALKTQ